MAVENLDGLELNLDATTEAKVQEAYKARKPVLVNSGVEYEAIREKYIRAKDFKRMFNLAKSRNITHDIDEMVGILRMYDFLSRNGLQQKVSMEEVYEITKMEAADAQLAIQKLLLGESAVKFEELNQLDPIKQAHSIFDSLTDEQIIDILNDKDFDNVDEEVVFEKINKIKAEIRRDYRLRYVKTRNKLDADGKLNTFMSVEEIDKVNKFADKMVNADPRVRALREDFEQNKRAAKIINQKTLTAQYKKEQLKEWICHLYRCTPESYDKWQRAIMEDRMKAFEQMQHGGLMRNFLLEQRRIFSTEMSETMKKYDHLLEFVPEDHTGVIYKSRLVNLVDRIEEKKVAESKRAMARKDPKAIQLFDQLCSTLHLENKQNLTKSKSKFHLVDVDSEINRMEQIVQQHKEKLIEMTKEQKTAPQLEARDAVVKPKPVAKKRDLEDYL